jgi:hypothetical protein
MQFPLPPRRIHPDAFFTEYLPSLWEMLSSGELIPDWEFEVEVCLQNKSGLQRTYSLHIFDGKLGCEIQPSAAPIAAVHAPLFAWRQFVTGVLPLILRHANEHPNRIKEDFKHLVLSSKKNFDPARIEYLPGKVELIYTDDAGDLLHAVAYIGNGNGPKATIQMNEATLFRILKMSSGLSAILRSELEIGGNAGYLLKVVQELELQPTLN